MTDRTNRNQEEPTMSKGPNEVSPEQFAESTGNTAPLDLFEKITGLSDPYDEPMSGFGFLEISVLGHALVAYAENPRGYLERTETTE